VLVNQPPVTGDEYGSDFLEVTFSDGGFEFRELGSVEIGRILRRRREVGLSESKGTEEQNGDQEFHRTSSDQDG
jgi:hypothetical protein